MAHTNIAHRRTHNLLLISKLLSQRDHASPFTLVLDSLEQTATPLLDEYVRRANLSKCPTMFLSFESITPLTGTNAFIPCHNKTPTQIAQAVANAFSSSPTGKQCLVIIDSLAALATWSIQPRSSLNLTAFLSSILRPASNQKVAVQHSMVAVYHTDVPLQQNQQSCYAPNPLSLLSYLATTIITVHSLPILLAEKQAKDRSLAGPLFGLAEEREGILIGLLSKLTKVSKPDMGIVLELEHRRKSGRGVLEWYYLPTSRYQEKVTAQTFRETVSLLDDHPLWRRPKEEERSQMTNQELAGMTFELGLTDRQKQEREGVVLPYFDAQTVGGGGDGGRILYDMGAEDDFDEEEDEM